MEIILKMKEKKTTVAVSLGTLKKECPLLVLVHY